jgi:hypothetical protein
MIMCMLACYHVSGLRHRYSSSVPFSPSSGVCASSSACSERVIPPPLLALARGDCTLRARTNPQAWLQSGCRIPGPTSR